MLTEDTKERPGPLDAFETLQPGEKHYTLQGGDPLAPPTILFWARLARFRAGVGKLRINDIVRDLLATIAKLPPIRPAEEQELLIRAASSEEIAWDMQAYQKGHTAASYEAAYEQSRTEALDAELTPSLASLLRHKRLRRIEQTLSNAAAEVMAAGRELQELELYEEGGNAAHISVRLADLTKRVAPTRKG